MGLAASQARLLSITSRMSDNELRSQLINNAKMRLTTDSAKVSDEYIAALNATQLMFTNFDPDGNEMYQALTFNSLTAYSAYNTQYGIVNTSGSLIVSATDAANFNTANGSLEKFLELYGLEQTTDYFDTMDASLEYADKGIGYYDKHGAWQQFEVTTEELQAMYEAEMDAKGITHYGQEDSLNSIEYGDYQTLVEDYNIKKDAYDTKLEKAMKDFLQGEADVIPGNQFKVNGKAFDDYYSDVLRYCDGGAGDLNTFKDVFLKFADKVGLTSSLDIDLSAPANERLMLDHYGSSDKNTALLSILKENIAIVNAATGSTVTQYFYEPSGVTRYAKINKSDGSLAGEVTGTPGYLSPPGSGTDDYSGYGMANFSTTDPGGGQPVTNMGELTEDDNYRYEPMYEYVDGAGNTKYTYPSADDYDTIKSTYELTACTGPVIRTETSQITQSDKNEALRYLYEAFRSSIYSNMSSVPFEEQCADVKDAWDDYVESAKKLANFIYGDGNGDTVVDEMVNNADYKKLNMIDYLDDPSWVLSTNTTDYLVSKDTDGDGVSDVTEAGDIEVTHFNPFYDKYPTTAAAPDPYTSNLGDNSGADYTVNYQVVKDLFLLDCMLEHYGEPTYTWIDRNDKDEDGQAKSTWYSNLFARMQEGYQVIGDGLSNNREWLQFAFESGLVHMEQVNKSSEWVSTMYSNCSNITESTIDVDITIAEAKYKREMAKIEAKDKKYDIELKNIDTEHESLKQEYESIKQVITKNIDRNFKMFQNA